MSSSSKNSQNRKRSRSRRQKRSGPLKFAKSDESTEDDQASPLPLLPLLPPLLPILSYSMEISENGDEYFKKFHEEGILKHILMNLESRRNAAQVNKEFYSTACAIDNEQDIYKLKFTQTNAPMILDSVLNSKRSVTEVEIREIDSCTIDYENKCIPDKANDILSTFVPILSKFSGTIKKLTFHECLLADRTFLSLLMAINNSPLEELNVHKSGLFFIEAHNDPIELQLPYLKSIDMSGTNYGNPFDKIDKQNLIAMFLNSFPDLEKFAALPTVLEMISLDKFNFKSLGIHKNKPHRKRIAAVISRQYNLTHLDLNKTFIMDDVVAEILRLDSLKSLKINVQAISMKAFSNVCKMETLKELHLEVTSRFHWFTSALSTFALVNITKLSLDLTRMIISAESLRDMFKARIKDLEVMTSQKLVLHSVLTSPCSVSLESLTVKLYPNETFTSKPVKALFGDINNSFSKLKNLNITNKIPELSGFTRDLITLVTKLPSLQKVKFKGFYILEPLHNCILKLNAATIEELILIDVKDHPGYQLSYVIPSTCERAINRCKNLKMMKISCIQSYYQDFGRFPIMNRAGDEVIFRYR